MARGLRSTSTTSPAPSSRSNLNVSVEWEATLVQPKNKVDGDSVQPVVVGVTAPISLENSRAQISIGGSWLDAVWAEGGTANKRDAVVQLPGDLSAGSKVVRVRVFADDQTPILTAGRIRVR